jgi:cation diffusion facilitator CzcD-associated flavoprotein CzcO
MCCWRGTAKSGAAGETRRWDSFTLVVLNWAVQLPGSPYRGDNSDGFMERAKIVSHLEQYVSGFGAPVRFGVTVTAIDPGRALDALCEVPQSK